MRRGLNSSAIQSRETGWARKRPLETNSVCSDCVSIECDEFVVVGSSGCTGLACETRGDALNGRWASSRCRRLLRIDVLCVRWCVSRRVRWIRAGSSNVGGGEDEDEDKAKVGRKTKESGAVHASNKAGKKKLLLVVQFQKREKWSPVVVAVPSLVGSVVRVRRCSGAALGLWGVVPDSTALGGQWDVCQWASAHFLSHTRGHEVRIGRGV